MKKVKINGKQYSVKFTLGSLIKFQEETGENPLESKTLSNLDPLKVRALLFAVIQEDIKLEDIDSLTIPEIQKVAEVLSEIMDSETEEKK
jgi:hypothetical protein